MMFQFLSGRRPPNDSLASGSPEELEASWAYEQAQLEHSLRANGTCADPAHLVSPLPQPGSCSVEKACAAFHEAQAILAAATSGSEEIDPELCAQRDKALEQVRGFAALTRGAVQAKKQVLDAMRDWLSVDAPEVGAFAFEVATEAVALLECDPAQDCSCQHAPGDDQSEREPISERRHPFSWFTRPRAQTTEAPFAN